MPHIDLQPGIPGIRSALEFRPTTARLLLDLERVVPHGYGGR